jgi:hypothetical protein
MKALQKSALLIGFLLSFSTISVAAQSSEASTQFEPAVSVSLDLNERTRLNFFSGREKNEELESGKWNLSAGISFRTKRVFKRFLDALDTDKRHVLVLSVGYEFSRGSEAQVSSNEHKIMLDATVRWAFKGDFLLSGRNRFEPRWVNGDTHFRIRERLTLERPFKISMKGRTRKITPYGRAESFWDQRYKKWNIFRFGGGVEVPFFRRSSIDFSYERMHCLTCTDQNTNIFTLTLNLYLRRKKT